jgi:hypothetical protein
MLTLKKNNLYVMVPLTPTLQGDCPTSRILKSWIFEFIGFVHIGLSD